MADSVSKNLVYEPFLDRKENNKYVGVEEKEMCASKIVFTFLKCCYICIQTLQDITDMGTSVGLHWMITCLCQTKSQEDVGM